MTHMLIGASRNQVRSLLTTAGDDHSTGQYAIRFVVLIVVMLINALNSSIIVLRSEWRLE